LGDGVSVLEVIEVVAVGLFAGVVLVVALSVALDNFNLWRRKR